MIRIVRIAALDSAIARFDAWWTERSRRERVMLAGLASFLAILILVFLVIKPIQAARAQAYADIRTYETLNARIRAAGALTPGAATAPGPRSGTPVEMVNGAAAAAGLVATVAPADSGAHAEVADAGYDAVMAWIADVGATTPLRVTRVSIRRRPAPGHVSATVDFQP